MRPSNMRFNAQVDAIYAIFAAELVSIPIHLSASGRKHVNPQGELWASVLESTGQPANLF